MNYQFPKSGQQVVNKHHISYFLLSGDFFEVVYKRLFSFVSNQGRELWDTDTKTEILQN